MNLKNRKETVSRMLGVGKDRIVFNTDHLDDIKEAITKYDLRGLIAQGKITILPKHGVSKGRFRKHLQQKRKGRRSGKGARKGSAGARMTRKEGWMNKIRSQRTILKQLKEQGQLDAKDFREAYRLAKGGAYRSKRHLRTSLEETNVLKKNESTTVQKKKATKN